MDCSKRTRDKEGRFRMGTAVSRRGTITAAEAEATTDDAEDEDEEAARAAGKTRGAVAVAGLLIRGGVDGARATEEDEGTADTPSVVVRVEIPPPPGRPPKNALALRRAAKLSSTLTSAGEDDGGTASAITDGICSA